MSEKLLGVIDATTTFRDLDGLMAHRSLVGVPIAGRYRMIDFVLSSMVNTGIQSIALFTTYPYSSLLDHLESGKNWNLSRKRDGLFFFPSPHLGELRAGIGSFSHFAENIDYFKRASQEYCLIANCFTILNTDFRPVLEKHMELGCDITEIIQNGRRLDMYLIKTSLLIELVETRADTGYTCMSDVVNGKNCYTRCTYEYPGHVFVINSIESYYSVSMELLKHSVRRDLFLITHPIYTKVKDEPPTRYKKGSTVKNALIANGCIIEGTVENSIIFRGVKIGKGAVVKNSIVMQKCHIGENCVVDTAILDKDVKMLSGTVFIGSQQQPLVVPKGTVQGALMNS